MFQRLLLTSLLIALVGACTAGPDAEATGAVRPSPSWSASARQSPASAPSATATSSIRPPLGRANQAILAKHVSGDGNDGEAIEISLMSLDGGDRQPAAEVIARLPVILPPASWIDQPQVLVSRTGWVALSFRSGPNYDDSAAWTLFLDLLDPDRPPWTVEADMSWSVWGPDDRLLIVEPTTATREQPLIRVFTPADRTASTVPADISISPINAWLADGTGIIAVRTGERDEFGVLSLNGAFRSLNDVRELPRLFAATGLERPAGRGLRTGGVGCDAGGSEAGGGCAFVVREPDGVSMMVWARDSEARRVPSGYAWDATGQGFWTVTTAERGTDGSNVVLVHLSGPGSRREIGSTVVDRPPYWSAQILGITGESSGRGILLIGEDDRLYAAFSEDGSALTFGGDAMFAGWADDPGGYDPAGQ